MREHVAAGQDSNRDTPAAPLRIAGNGRWLDAGRPVRDADAALARRRRRDRGVRARRSHAHGARWRNARRASRARRRAEGQWLALDPFGAPSGTLGATIATGSAGPLAHAFGTPRDNVLGIEVVTGTGDIVRAGGRVVKNVAGFDLTRLFTGAWGTLAVITEVTVRLRARPERDETIALRASRRATTMERWLAQLRALPFSPLALELVNAPLADGARPRRPRAASRRAWAATRMRCARSCARSARSATCVDVPGDAGARSRSRARRRAPWCACLGTAVAPARALGSRSRRGDDALARARRGGPRHRALRSVPQRDARARRRGSRASRDDRGHSHLRAPPGRASGAAISFRVNDPLSRARARRIRSRSAFSIAASSESRRERASAPRPRARFPARRSPRASAGINACVHCGFCLQACPTYLALGDENDSPARPHLPHARARRRASSRSTIPSVHTHIDRCLGCRACETACPSGVPYGALLEATRATLSAVKRPPLRARLILALFARRAADARRGRAPRGCCARPGFPSCSHGFPAISASRSRCSRRASRRSPRAHVRAARRRQLAERSRCCAGA